MQKQLLMNSTKKLDISFGGASATSSTELWSQHHHEFAQPGILIYVGEPTARLRTSLFARYHQPSEGDLFDVVAALRAAFNQTFVGTCGSFYESAAWWMGPRVAYPRLESGKVIGQAPPMVARETARAEESPVVAAAKARWQQNFSARIALVDHLLHKVEENLVPTPKGDGDE